MVYKISAYMFLLATLLFPIHDASELLIRKCCLEWQQVDSNGTCADIPNYQGNRSWPVGTKLSVADLRNEIPSHYPWWMDSEAILLNSTTLNPVGSFLEGQEDSKYIEYGVRPSCELHMMKRLRAGSETLNALHNGSIIYRVNKGLGPNITFSPSSYCADVLRVDNSRTLHAIFLCPCLEAPCIQKCCKRGHYLTLSTGRREMDYNCSSKNDNSTTWTPRMYYDNLTEIENPAPLYVLLYSDGIVCPEGRYPVAIEPNNPGFWRFPNGSVLTKSFGKGVPFNPEHTCGDLSAINNNKTLVENLFVCGESKKLESPTAHSQFYISLYIIGLLFMVLTLVMFAFVPETRKKNTNFVVFHIIIQIPPYIVLALNLFFSVVPHAICKTIPFIIQFSFLAAFFWLNVMCIDISWAFSGFRPPQGSVSERDRKKFIYYSLYAWGSPTIIFIVTAVMEFVESIPDTYLKPDFGVKACWFKDKSASFAYFYGPMAALLLANFILFIYTTVKIIQVQRDTRILHNGESGRHDGSNFKKDKKRLILYAKLFCLMGLTWITEIISVLYQDSPQYYWYVTDAINLLRAVFIFIIFCCKRKVFRLLKQRLFPSFVAENNASQSNGTRKSSSSTQNSTLPPIRMTQLSRNGKVPDKTTPEKP